MRHTWITVDGNEAAAVLLGLLTRLAVIPLRSPHESAHEYAHGLCACGELPHGFNQHNKLAFVWWRR